MLTPAEALLGLSRHLAMYALGPDKAAIGNLEYAGRVLEIAVRLRGSGVTPGQRVHAIGLSAGISVRELDHQILPTLETLEWLECRWSDDSSLVAVSENIPPLLELVEKADAILSMVQPDAVERALLRLLDETIVMPLTVPRAMEIGTEIASEEECARAIGFLEALNLVELRQTDSGDDVISNPGIWALDAGLSAAALRAEDASVHSALSGLIEEIAATPGLPETLVTSASKDWIHFAVAKGLIHRTLVVTSDATEQAFLFAPHMGRNAFDAMSGVDPSGHVRQLIGSMMYAGSFARYRLSSPAVFLRRLVADGEAGDASPIGTDYPMLETAGIVRVEPADRFFKFVLLQSDVAETALTYLEQAGDPTGSALASGLREQQSYRHPEQERAKLGRVSDTRPEETRRLVEALREVAGRRRYG